MARRQRRRLVEATDVADHNHRQRYKTILFVVLRARLLLLLLMDSRRHPSKSERVS